MLALALSSQADLRKAANDNMLAAKKHKQEMAQASFNFAAAAVLSQPRMVQRATSLDLKALVAAEARTRDESRLTSRAPSVAASRRGCDRSSLLGWWGSGGGQTSGRYIDSHVCVHVVWAMDRCSIRL